jgi:hypothetical protein
MLPREIFEEYEVETQITNEAKVSADELLGWKINEIKWGRNGIETIIDGADFPSRGYAPPEAVFANNIVKRMIVRGLPVINPLRYEAILDAFSDVGWKVMSPYILKTEYLTPFSKEIYKLTKLFLEEIKINQADRIAKLVAHLFEYDNAYRLRLEDLFSETTPELLCNDPRKEIVRLLELNRAREVQHKEGVSNKFKLIANALGVLILIPKINKAFKKAIKEIDYKNLCIDNTELYWMCHRTDYAFCGKTYEERLELLENSGYKLVKGQKYNV